MKAGQRILVREWVGQSTPSRLALSTVLVLVFSAVLVAAQGSVAVHIEGSPDDWASNFPVMELPLSVVGPNGLPIVGLSKDRFSVTEDGSPAEIQDVLEETDRNAPVYVVLAIDISGSMAAGNALDQAKEAAALLVDTLGPNDKVAIIAFGDHVEVAPPGSPQPIDPAKERNFTNNKEDALTLIRSLATVPGRVTTPLWDAALKSVLLAANVPVERRAVILLTDGKEGDQNGNPVSTYGENDAIFEAVKSRVPVFTIGLGPHVYEPYLRTLAERTGGTYTFTDDPTKLKDIYLDLLSRFKTRYRLQYKSTLRADGKPHVVEIRVETPLGVASQSHEITIVKPIVISHIYYLKPSEVKGEPPKRVEIRGGEEFEGGVTLEPTIDAPNGVKYVEYYIDGRLYKTVTEPPYRIYLDAANYAQRTTLNITIRAYDKTEPAIFDEATVTITLLPGAPPPPPGWLLALGGVLIALFSAIVIFFVRKHQLRREVIPSPPTIVGAVTTKSPSASGSGTVESSSVGSPFQVPPGGEALAGSTIPEVDVPSTNAVPGAGSAPVAPTTTQIGLDPVDGQPSAWFTGISGSVQGRTFSISGIDVTIGRSPDNQITIDDPTVSRQHARIRLINDRYQLFDVGSTNGTFVNSTRVQNAVLRDGDEVQFGDVKLKFHMVR